MQQSDRSPAGDKELRAVSYFSERATPTRTVIGEDKVGRWSDEKLGVEDGKANNAREFLNSPVSRKCL